MRVHFDVSCSPALRLALVEPRGGEAVQPWIESDPSRADVIIFGSDEIGYFSNNPLYCAHKAKSICISESDIPTFYLPGLYAANMSSAITASRTRTASYFISQRAQGNPEVHKLIGKPVEKRFLYSFMGGSNSWPRKRLFNALHSSDDVLVEPSDSYNHWQKGPGEEDARVLRMRRYAEIMAASRFTLCPRGCGLSSYRLFESMSLGVAPVIISDGWRPVEEVDWSFALFIREKDIPRVDVIVRSHADEWKQRGEAGQTAYRRFFSDEAIPVTLHAGVVDVLSRYNARREALLAPVIHARAVGREGYWAAYRAAKHLVLLGYSMTGRSVPIQLNRPIEVQLGRKAGASELGEQDR